MAAASYYYSTSAHSPSADVHDQQGYAGDYYNYNSGAQYPTAGQRDPSAKLAPPSTQPASTSRGISVRRPNIMKPRRVLGTGLIPSFSSGLFLAVVIVEALAVLGLVISVFAIVQLRTEVLTQDAKTVPVFLALFVFGMVFLVLVALDAFRLHNTIQIIGAVVFNLALLITAALQISQVRAAFDNQDRYGRGVPCQDRPGRRCGAVATLYPAVKPQLVATPIIIAVAQVLITYLTFKLWQDFGFQIYRKIGADLVKRKMMLIYQVFVVFLKFDFFFGVSFCLAYLILVSQHQDAEFGLTIAALPAAIIVLVLSAVAVRREVYFLMIFCILCMFAGIVYFVFKITRIFEPATEDEYRTVRLSMTFFSVFSIVSLVATIVLAIWCTINFGKGLKDAHESLGGLFSRHRLGAGFLGKKSQDTYDGNGTGDSNGMGGRIELTDSIPENAAHTHHRRESDMGAVSPSDEYSSATHRGNNDNSMARKFSQQSSIPYQGNEGYGMARQPSQQSSYAPHQTYSSYPSGQTSPSPRLQPNPSIYSNHSTQAYYQQQQQQQHHRQQQQSMTPASPPRPSNSRRISLD